MPNSEIADCLLDMLTLHDAPRLNLLFLLPDVVPENPRQLHAITFDYEMWREMARREVGDVPFLIERFVQMKHDAWLTYWQNQFRLHAASFSSSSSARIRASQSSGVS